MSVFLVSMAVSVIVIVSVPSVFVAVLACVAILVLKMDTKETKFSAVSMIVFVPESPVVFVFPIVSGWCPAPYYLMSVLLSGQQGSAVEWC